MAAIEGKITMSTCEERPCWVSGRRAIFHRWTDSARPARSRNADGEEQKEQQLQLHNVHALVEYEDGTMEREWPNKVQFADSDRIFSQWDWDAMERRRDELPYTYEEQPAAEPDPTPQEDQEAPEIYKECESCTHVTENTEFCKTVDFNCERCTIRGCTCKRCENYSHWEPKEGTA